ncbi:MAG TPA: YdcF family protein [Steroidobacteraceae bacterium]|nr:YdcF family protein [Steroidobacteraceae bacterium]
MGFLFLLKKFITMLVLPPFSILLLAIIGLLLIKRWPRVGRAIVWTSVITILLLATPFVAGLLLQSINVAPPFDTAAGKSAQAIIVLGGGLRRNTPVYGDTPTLLTLDRVRDGATLARQTGLPILVSGGAVIGKTPEAQVMAKVLESEFNVPVRWQEIRSLDTEDNLKFSAELLKAERIRKVILVTHDFHMLRSLAHCEAAGLICIPAPVSFAGRSSGSSWVYKLPSAEALENSSLALHEIIGYVALSLK